MVRSEAGFQRDVMRGIGRYSETHGPWRFLAPVSGGEDRTFPLAAMQDPNLDGLLATASHPRDQEQLQALNVPFVCLTMVDDGPMVSNDNRAIGRLGAEHLLDQGFEHLAFIGMPNARYVVERKQGFVEVAERRGGRCTIVDEIPWVWERAFEPLQRFLQALPLPCGVMASNDIRGRQVAEAAASLGIHVPEQLAVLGVDDDEPICSLTTPPLSSIALNGERVGFEAAAMLDKLMAGQTPEHLRVLVPPLAVEVRQSTDQLVIDDAEVAAALRYIRQNPARQLTVYDVLGEVLVGRRALERRFQETTGRTLFEEIRRVQIEHAKRLVRDTTWSIERIAGFTAFKTAKRLRDVFQQELRESPTSFRRRHADDDFT